MKNDSQKPTFEMYDDGRLLAEASLKFADDLQKKHQKDIRILDHKRAKDILTKLLLKFGDSDTAYIDKYLKTQPKVIPFSGSSDQYAFPILWYPQKPGMKFVREIWEDYLSVTDRCYCFDTVREYIVPTILTLISEKNLYGAGNWAYQTRIDHNAIEFATKELTTLVEFYGEMETYLFPENLKWILCLTHEDFSFVAGAKIFINQIRKAFPDYEKYEPDFDQLTDK